MSTFNTPMADMTIPNGLQASAWMVANKDYRDGDSIMFYSPTTLPETVNIQVAANDNPQAGDERTYQEGGIDVVLNAAKALQVLLPASVSMRLFATGAVGADRVFHLSKKTWA